MEKNLKKEYIYIYIYMPTYICIAFMHAESLQLCLTLCNPMACRLPGSCVEFSRQEYWSGLPFPPSWILPTQILNPGLLHLLRCRRSFTTEPAGKPIYTHIWGSPGGAGGKEPTCQCERCQETQVQSLGKEDPLEKNIATQSNILAWRIP